METGGQSLSQRLSPPSIQETAFLKGVTQLVLFVCASVKEIARLGRKYPWVKPAACPRCGGHLWWHGFVEAWFSSYNHCLYLRRLFCPQCRSVHRLKPSGYWKHYRSSVKEIRSSIKHRQDTRCWRPDLPRSRQRQWRRRLCRMMHLFLGLSFKGTLLEGFDQLVDDNIIPVNEATEHTNRLIRHTPYRIVALPGVC